MGVTIPVTVVIDRNPAGKLFIGCCHGASMTGAVLVDQTGNSAFLSTDEPAFYAASHCMASMGGSVGIVVVRVADAGLPYKYLGGVQLIGDLYEKPLSEFDRLVDIQGKAFLAPYIGDDVPANRAISTDTLVYVGYDTDNLVPLAQTKVSGSSCSLEYEGLNINMTKSDILVRVTQPLPYDIAVIGFVSGPYW